MFVTFFLAMTLLHYVVILQNGTVSLIFGEEVIMKGNVC